MAKKKPDKKPPKKPVRKPTKKSPAQQPTVQPVEPPVEQPVEQPANKGRSDYEQYKRRQADISRAKSEAGRHIGCCPAAADVATKERCRLDFKTFCLTYLSVRFPLPFSANHDDVLGYLQRCILKGGRFALAMPRGSGKTTLCEAACMWALVYGHRRFIVLVGATDAHAIQLMDSIKTELETNELLGLDFPEVCYPITSLERIANRANGQTCGNPERPTYIEWSANKLVMPTVFVDGKPSTAAGSAAVAVGITGRIRGQKHVTSQGKSLRPDLVIVDDPQTDESAASPAGNDKREQILKKAVLGLAGPGKTIAAIMPCTVIQPDDMADRILDRDRNPEWSGRKYQMLGSFPVNLALWQEYNKVRLECLKHDDKNMAAANEFYLTHRATLDAGAVVGWEHDFEVGEISAIQHAMNLWFTDPDAFAAERQNEPRRAIAGIDLPELSPDDITKRVTQLPHRKVPADATRVVQFIDIQGNMLFYAQVAFNEKYDGRVIDYGTWPRQEKTYFRKSDAYPTFADMYVGYAEEAAIYRALEELTEVTLGKQYERDGVADLVSVDRCLIDSGFNASVVKQFCRESKFKSVVMPSKGFGLGKSQKSMDDWTAKDGEQRGMGFIVRLPHAGTGVKLVQFDSYFWKTFVDRRWRTPFGSPGNLGLYGSRPVEHQLFADHCTSEKPVEDFGNGRTVIEWKHKSNRPDNDWLDCLVGCHVAVGVAGLVWSSADAIPGERPIKLAKPKKSLREQLEEQRAKRPGFRPA